MYRSHVLVCSGTGCTSSGCVEVQENLEKELSNNKLENEVKLIQTGCHGLCELGPIVIVYPEGTSYFRVEGKDVKELVEEHLLKGRPVDRLMYKEPISEEQVPYYNDINFYKKQSRIVLRNCGYIDPESIEEYIARGGYDGLSRALSEFSQDEVIEEVKESGLRGRGGAGFPTGVKWGFARQAPGDKKYIICNADEGDPGAFMDRSILEGDPHSVIEGMAIGGYAIGADEGYIYVRAEYPLAIKRLRKALEAAEGLGLLGENILGTGFNFKLKIKEGAGAFVCGEETALMASIEGNRGMPRPRPPFPAQKGLWGKPSNINNVETLACVPVILSEGAGSFNSVGTENSKGTKVFALTGKINNTGLVEVPMGIKIKDIIYTIGGGIQEDKAFKAVQIGGPSGGCLPEDKIDLPVDYDSLTQAGAIMGSGGLVVMDEETCIVDVARFFLKFTQTESCGKCTPCREGTKRMLEILERITQGEGKEGDVELLEELGSMVKETSLCGLGQTAPNPVLSTTKHFRDEYNAHILDRRCPAGACSDLLIYKILEDKCKGCTKCVKACPQDAITGEKKEVHVIDQDKCIKCGACVDQCKFEAIVLG
ncbi:NADH-quinone oxidoreductase subunit NuoF [Natranaerofaba carboxydovora]|uniref:NADH-quinone oxidoreductase subunit NuoF n=1 Tax=Natranaerofaba carboxydovora TaxID=2742683 RepID=UPI001F13CDFD|nr:NADH-quinone oxidoreductase subunit NuoF [Natranaerofaba carboxydovora]UMZ75300.1 NADP-reducing hydrogenase subunit HndC [Natranaerofaba carboxydovora]